MASDLVVGPDSEERGNENIISTETGDPRCNLVCCLQAVASDDDRLHQHIEFQVFPALASLLTDMANRCIEPFRLPTHFMMLAVVECPPEHGESDDVGVPGRMGQSPLAVDPHEQGHAILCGT